MITDFEHFDGNNRYNQIKEVLNKLVNKGNIKLNNINIDEITDLLGGKTNKYPSDSFESRIIRIANGDHFFPETIFSDLPDIIKKLDKLSIDTTELKKYASDAKNITDKENELNSLDYEYNNFETMSEEDYNTVYSSIQDEIDILYKRRDNVKKILIDISKEVVKYL